MVYNKFSIFIPFFNKFGVICILNLSFAFSPTLFLRFSFDRRNVDPLGTDDVGGSEANGLSKRPGDGGGGGVLLYISYIGMCRPIG